MRCDAIDAIDRSDVDIDVDRSDATSIDPMRAIAPADTTHRHIDIDIAHGVREGVTMGDCVGYRAHGSHAGRSAGVVLELHAVGV